MSKWHIFPNGPMCSLRRAMMLWLFPMFLVVGAGSAGVTYWSYCTMVGMFLDDQMEQIADALATNEMPQPPQLTRERVQQWGAYVVQTWASDGALQVTSFPTAHVPLQSEAGFHDLKSDGTHWRVLTTPAKKPGGHTVQVLQSDDFRQKLAAERAGAAIAPFLLMLPLAMLVLWGVARTMSRALQDIGRQAAQQDEHHIAELALTNVPQEIVPLVSSFNSLLRRLRDAFSTQRRFVQDAAHELRTPIAAIGLQVENMRSDMNCPAAEASFAQLEYGVRRAQRLDDQLLR